MTDVGASIDYAAEGLLADLRSERDREARVRLLDDLTAAGVPLERLKQAVAQGRLATLPIELVFTRGCDHRLREAVADVGLSEDYLRRHFLALGLPMPPLDELALNDDDMVAWRMTHAILESGFSEEALLEMVRVSGRGAAQLAEVSLDNFVRTFMREGDTELDFGLRLAGLASDLKPVIGPVTETPLRWHIRDRIRREVISSTERMTGRVADTHELAVGFVDLVGYTRISAAVPAERLRAIVALFESLAVGVAKPPVRLVKLIGDAAMLVSPDPSSLVGALMELIDALDGDPSLPQGRAGAALGAAMGRGGDWFGPPVNLASRITDIAPANGILATATLALRVKETFLWSAQGSRHLRGIDVPVELYSCNRADRAMGPILASDGPPRSKV